MFKGLIGTQIFLKNVNYNELQKHDYLKKKLAFAKEILGLEVLLIWPDDENKNLDLAIKICQELKIKTYLWYSILADNPFFRIRMEQAVETFNGLYGYGIYGKWNKLGQGEEEFLFLCPNNEEMTKKIINHFQNILKSTDVDGIFLDRIRFPSPANGLETIYTCFCPHCQTWFHHDYKEDLVDLKEKINYFFKELQLKDVEKLSNYPSLSNIFISSSIEKLFDFRKKSIYKITEKFAKLAKIRNKLVGLDLFPPSLSDLVGQDYSLLANICDWIKPMIYSHTMGPAGFPLELYSLIEALTKFNKRIKEVEFTNEISRIIGVRLPETIREIAMNGISETIIQLEVQKLNKLALPEKVKIYLGWEAVQVPGIVHINKSILKRYIDFTRSLNINGVILSWNLLQIPNENLKLVGELLLKR